MPVTVRLIYLLDVPGTGVFAPQECCDIAAKIAEDPSVYIAWGVLADWLDADGETELASAARYIFKHPELNVHWEYYSGRQRLVSYRWPAPIQDAWTQVAEKYKRGTYNCPLEFLHALWGRLDYARKKACESLEELE